jgi:hypothetical protein
MTPDELLKELGEYFRQKLLTGDYQFISCGEHTAEIKIDGHRFNVWIANDQPNNFNFYWYATEQLLKDHIKLHTLDEKKQAYSHIKKHLDNYKATQMKELYEREIARMNKELDKLKVN